MISLFFQYPRVRIFCNSWRFRCNLNIWCYILYYSIVWSVYKPRKLKYRCQKWWFETCVPFQICLLWVSTRQNFGEFLCFWCTDLWPGNTEKLSQVVWLRHFALCHHCLGTRLVVFEICFHLAIESTVFWSWWEKTTKLWNTREKDVVEHLYTYTYNIFPKYLWNVWPK